MSYSFVDSFQAGAYAPAQKLSKNLYDIYQEHMLLLKSCLHTCMTYTVAESTVNKLQMMDRWTAQNM